MFKPEYNEIDFMVSKNVIPSQVMGIIRGKNIIIAEVVVISMIVNVIIGSLIGILLPFIFAKFKKDPATASTPLITTLADIIGTGIFLGIAYLILG